MSTGGSRGPHGGQAGPGTCGPVVNGGSARVEANGRDVDSTATAAVAANENVNTNVNTNANGGGGNGCVGERASVAKNQVLCEKGFTHEHHEVGHVGNGNGDSNGFTEHRHQSEAGFDSKTGDANANRKRSFLAASGSFNGNGDPTVTKVSRLLDTS